MKKIVVSLFAVCLVITVQAQKMSMQGVSAEEKKVMDYIDANMPRAIALLKESVDINSGSLNIAGVKKVGEIFAREFEKAGFKN